MEDKKLKDLVYLDFSKAFDKIPAEKMVAKVEAVGNHSMVISWVRQLLKRRIYLFVYLFIEYVIKTYKSRQTFPS